MKEAVATLVMIAALSCFLIIAVATTGTPAAAPTQAAARPTGVCPPFPLRNEQGTVINPVKGENDAAPYSPKQTCGAPGCHDYAKITEGYHFTQGAGEKPTAQQAERCQWVSSPGNYGGTWCSPAPLYRYLSAKENDSPRAMDMTSFSFITAGCGACHPGGGPMEFDREGKRYDVWMSTPESGLKSGGENNYDGDYYQARWSETGVLEADCLLCHLPEYSFADRKKQLTALNFRWAATAGAGLAKVAGSIDKGEPVTVAYDKSKFNPDGTLSPRIVREPRNEACLECHAQPGWKKRGANFRARTDVHLRAGLRCVDCHPAGSSATDPRISGREVHQIAKGDDPGGLVRDDLDNTMPTCSDCHDSGRLGAPVAEHGGLPPLHLQRIACQTCHIPEREVMPIQFQAGDVFNPAPKIPTGGKQLWTFYGPDGKWRNHYGYLEMMGYDDKPTERFRPILALYKEKIYPVNRVHSAWPALEIEGRNGLMQPKMSDIYKMWTSHQKDPGIYPELAKIADDNGDSVPEVNRPEEIDALIASVTKMLNDTHYPMEGKRVVWAMDDRVYYSGTEYRTIPIENWEASPYGNVHKYNHDVYPAKAALGINGCEDCHAPSSAFFFGAVSQYPFDGKGRAVTVPQYDLLGMSRAASQLGVVREWFLKPWAAWFLGAVVFVLLLHFALLGRPSRQDIEGATPPEVRVERFRVLERLAHLLALVTFLVLAVTGFCFLLGHRDPLAGSARDLHAWVGWVFLAAFVLMAANWFSSMAIFPGDKEWLRNLGGYLGGTAHLPAGKFNAGQKIFFWLATLMVVALGLTGGAMFFLRDDAQYNLSLLYTVHDIAAVVFLTAVLAHFYLAVLINPESLRSVFGGRVSLSWARVHHPDWKIDEYSPMSEEK